MRRVSQTFAAILKQEEEEQGKDCERRYFSFAKVVVIVLACAKKST
jgi:hypothetical protein